MFIGPYRNQNNWIQPNEPLILQEDLENSVIERIIRNEFYRSPVKYKPARINWQDWLAGANNSRERPNENESDDFERRQYRPFVPGLHFLQYPQLSALTMTQHHQALRVLSASSQLKTYQTASRADHNAYEAMKEAYEKEQKEYIKWAKQSWVNGDCIRALRPKPVLEATYEAEFKMRSSVVQSLPQDYYLAAQIPLETDSHCGEMKLKAELITVDVLDLPCVEYPEVMESSLSVLKPCPLPRPCDDHPCNFVLPDEDSVSALPLSELHRKLAEYAMSNASQIIASENALHCLVQTQTSWNLPVSVIELVTPDGDTKNVIVLGSEFSVQKDFAIHRTYKAYRHLLQHAFTPSFDQYKMKKQDAPKSKVSETPRKSYEKPFFKESVNNTVASKETIAANETVASNEAIPSFSSFLAMDDDLAVSSDDDDDRLLIDDASPGKSNNISAAEVSKEIFLIDTVKRKLSFCDTNKNTQPIDSDTTNAKDCSSELSESARKMSVSDTDPNLSDNLSKSSDLVTTYTASKGFRETEGNRLKINRSEATSTPIKTISDKKGRNDIFTNDTCCELSATITNSISNLSNKTKTVDNLNFCHTNDTSDHDSSEPDINDSSKQEILTDITVEMKNTKLSHLKPNVSHSGSNHTDSDKSGIGNSSSASNKSSPENPFNGFGTRLMSSLLTPDVRKLSFDGSEIEIASNFSEIDLKYDERSISSLESPVVTKNTDLLNIKTVESQRNKNPSDSSNLGATHIPKKIMASSKTEITGTRPLIIGNQSIDSDTDKRIVNEANPSNASDIIAKKACVLLSRLNTNDLLTQSHISETDDTSTEPPNKKRRTAVTRSYSLRSKPNQGKHVTPSKSNENKKAAKGCKNSSTKGTEISSCRRVSDSSSTRELRSTSRLNSIDNKDDTLNSGQVECKLNQSTDKQTKTKSTTGVAIDKTDQLKVKLRSNKTKEELKSIKSFPENFTVKTEEREEERPRTRSSLNSSNTVSLEAGLPDRRRRYLGRCSTASSYAESDVSEIDNNRCTRRYNLRNNSLSANDSDNTESKLPKNNKHSSTPKTITRKRFKRSISDVINNSQSNTDSPNMDILSKTNEPEISEQESRIIKNEKDTSEISDTRAERHKMNIGTGQSTEDDHIDFIVQIELKTENNPTIDVDKSETYKINMARDEINADENDFNTLVTEDSDINTKVSNKTTETNAKEINISLHCNMKGKSKIKMIKTNEINATKVSDTLDQTEANSETNINNTLQSKLHDLFSDTDSSDNDVGLIKIVQNSSTKRKETRPKKDATDRLRHLPAKKKEYLDKTNNDIDKINTYTSETNKSSTKQMEQIDQTKNSSDTKDLSKHKNQETSVSQAKQTHVSQSDESISKAKETYSVPSRSDSVVSNSSENTEDNSILDLETLNISTLSKEDINDIIGVNNCSFQGSIFKVPPPRSFKKWQMSNKTGFDTFDVIVHSSHKVRKGKEEMILEPIVEYQPEKGGARLSDERATSLALSLMLRESAALLNVRIDHEKGEVILVERMSGAEFIQTHGDKSRDVAASLHCTLAQLRHLLPGQYVLHHDSSHGPNAMIYTAQRVSGARTLSLRVSAGSARTCDADETAHVRTAPDLVPILLPYHISRKILPCAFTPYKNQVKEDKKKALALKPKHPPQAIQWPKKKKKKIRRAPQATSYE